MWTTNKLRVAVLRGGASPEYEHSLRTGKYVIDNLPEEYESVDVFVSQDGTWHQSGIGMEPHRILGSVDAVWNALHGSFGEDGSAQRLIAHFGLPQAGSGHLASAFGMNKILAKQALARAGLKTPVHTFAEAGEEGRSIFERVHRVMPFPVVVKPAHGGSSIGLSVARNTSEVMDAVNEGLRYSPRVLLEEWIEGKPVSSGVIEGFRGRPHYTLLPHSAHNLSVEESHLVQEASVAAHSLLGLSDFSQADFIIHPRRGVFILEVNTLPKLHEQSRFISSLKSAGSNAKEFIAHTLKRILS